MADDRGNRRTRGIEATEEEHRDHAESLVRGERPTIDLTADDGIEHVSPRAGAMRGQEIGQEIRKVAPRVSSVRANRLDQPDGLLLQPIVVERQDEPMISALKRWGFKPVPCNFRNFNSFGGSFHCATLDVRRRGRLESYLLD